MEKIYIEPTRYTPEIYLDPDKGIISLKGKSYPENTFEFYEPIMKWIKEYSKNPKDTTTVNMEIVYFNSSTSKLFFNLLDILDEMRDKSKVIVNWIYDKENENAKEAGEDFVEDFPEMDIRLVEKDSLND
ncbi:conserved hypothetical protein [Nautilia profundicola AmH]|uniref:SiaC family regulatory phosphoprotein domain-containing protein n=1 Tax=Nautilia profundicola (strain ATCC BAA-1463 / DSM 18972 / AmH) TaxID=598659 RepID=B9L9U3_NAUPA|nr:DUF1987 domain-containing protein [Nautilia profundicola]ACM93789.1 conserved hypothetical protein [Nautilia profundicola AmH]